MQWPGLYAFRLMLAEATTLRAQSKAMHCSLR
ncbi:protein of unknown function [Modestobacter italicus]|uniref:Uncharacterized protein n=1 Tax=Modestobacter italicus (strain DSM 44449 / CECT 9708 / BC 501) TaxID=2732864 RepID=I4F0D3_MODI5|nr:protein of unknown function [Modestobacter marinus]